MTNDRSIFRASTETGLFFGSPCGQSPCAFPVLRQALPDGAAITLRCVLGTVEHLSGSSGKDSLK